MNELTELLENFWFVHQNDAGEYFRMKRALDGKLKKFINEFVGWNVTVNNKELCINYSVGCGKIV